MVGGKNGEQEKTLPILSKKFCIKEEAVTRRNTPYFKKRLWEAKRVKKRK